MTAVINVSVTIDRHQITSYRVGILVLRPAVALLDGFNTKGITVRMSVLEFH